ncbi:MAG: aminopeptidase P family protein [Actinobacteria bacterium]|nr:aminopeptidase P family protein [Actinomycetota bacterium]
MQSRIDRVQDALLPEQSFLVTNLINIRYLCGYSGSSALLVISKDAAILYTDSRYELQVASECFDVEIGIEKDLYVSAVNALTTPVCLFESTDVTVATLARVEKINPKISFTPIEFSIEKMRIVKDAGEVKLIKAACQISTAALESVIAQVQVGLTEKQIGIMLERTMIDLGADSIAFETIVASGPNSAIAHHQPTNREIIQGDLLKIDFGAKLGGYHSDCTRTFVIGKPSTWQIDIYQAVLAAQSASRGVVKSGVQASFVLEQTTTALKQSGYLENFRHGLGHGVGLEIHEDPFLSADPTTTLDAGTVITIEPGVYLPNQGGVRIEDTIVVTDTGYENLTVFAYELQEIG